MNPEIILVITNADENDQIVFFMSEEKFNKIEPILKLLVADLGNFKYSYRNRIKEKEVNK